MHSVVWLHDTICEAAVTDEPGTGNYEPSGVPYELCFTQPIIVQLSLLVSKVTGECKPIMDMPW